MAHKHAEPLPRAARALAVRGWHVFPLIPGTKHPAVRAWEHRATTAPERVARCWAFGSYNIGIATGPSRLVVVDLDIPKTPDDTPPALWRKAGVADGADALAALSEHHGQPYPADTYTVRTSSGGTHLYFTAPCGLELRNSAGKLGWKIDTRAAGGYVLAAGSTVDGRPYRVTRDTVPAPLPGWIADLLRPAPLPPQTPIAVPVAIDRHTAYLNSAVTGEVRRVATARPGGRNNALYLAAVALGQLVAGGELSEGDVTSWLTAAAAQTGQSFGEVRRTIASGLRGGARRPRTVAA